MNGICVCQKSKTNSNFQNLFAAYVLLEWLNIPPNHFFYIRLLGLLKKQIQNQNTILLHESWMVVYEEIPDSHSL